MMGWRHYDASVAVGGVLHPSVRECLYCCQSVRVCCRCGCCMRKGCRHNTPRQHNSIPLSLSLSVSQSVSLLAAHCSSSLLAVYACSTQQVGKQRHPCCLFGANKTAAVFLLLACGTSAAPHIQCSGLLACSLACNSGSGSSNSDTAHGPRILPRGCLRGSFGLVGLLVG